MKQCIKNKKRKIRYSFLRALCIELEKVLGSPFTAIMIIAVAGTCMLSVAYTDVDARQITVLGLFLQNNTEILLSDVNMNSLEIWRKGFGMWTYILFPLFLTGGYIHMLSEERVYGGTLFYLIREGRIIYCMVKTVSAMVSGGVILLGGYAVYGLMVMMGFPGLSTYQSAEAAYYLEQAGIENVILYIFSHCGWTFLYGMATGVFGYMVSVFFTEKYTLLCFPIMLSYIYSSVYSHIEQQMVDREQWKRQEIFQIFQFSNLINGIDFRSRVCTFFYALMWYFAGMLLFIYIMKKKRER